MVEARECCSEPSDIRHAASQIRELYKASGARYYEQLDPKVNPGIKPQTGGVELVLEWGVPAILVTPEGAVNLLCSSRQEGDTGVFWNKLTKAYSLQIISSKEDKAPDLDLGFKIRPETRVRLMTK